MSEYWDNLNSWETRITDATHPHRPTEDAVFRAIQQEAESKRRQMATAAHRRTSRVEIIQDLSKYT